MPPSSQESLDQALNVILDTAQSQLQSKQYAQAEMSFRVLIENCGDLPGLHVGLAEALAGLGKYDAAESSYRRATLNITDEPAVWYNYAFVLARQQKFSEAKRACSRVLELKPDPDALARANSMMKMLGGGAESPSGQHDLPSRTVSREPVPVRQPGPAARPAAAPLQPGNPAPPSPVAPVRPAGPIPRPIVLPDEVVALVDQVLSEGKHRCSKPFLLAVIELMSACRIDFGEPADWDGLDTAIAATGLTIDQILNCLSKETAVSHRPADRTFRVFAFDYEAWKAYCNREDNRDHPDARCWREFCDTATDAKQQAGNAAGLASFVRDAVRITRLPIDSVLDAMSTADANANVADGYDRPRNRGFHRFWLDGDHWERVRSIAPTCTPPELFLGACSWGYGRQWAAGYVGLNRDGTAGTLAGEGDQWLDRIKSFRLTPLLQIGFLAEKLDRLLEVTQHDETQAFAAYQADSIDTAAGGSVAIADTIRDIERGLNLSLEDIGPQIERLENKLRSYLESWTPDDLGRELALLDALDTRLADGSDPASQDGNHRNRLDRLLSQYAQLKRDLDDTIRIGSIDLSEAHCENLGQLSLAEVEARLHMLEGNRPETSSPGGALASREFSGQIEADRLLLRALEGRIIWGDEPFDQTRRLRDRINALNIDRDARRRAARGAGKS